MAYANWRKMKIARHMEEIEKARHARQHGAPDIAALRLERAAVIRTGIFCAREADFQHRVYGAANSRG